MNRSFVFLSLAICAGSSSAEELKDPRTRDENISGTVVSVDVAQQGDGLYRYVYSLQSPASNLGKVAGFSVDISCPGAPATDLGLPMADSSSDDGNHLAVTMEAEYGNAYFPRVDAINSASWGTQLRPGNSITGLRIYSAEPPADRTYEIIPAMRTAGWAYTEDTEGDPTIPWIEDFTVTGTTQGPKCPTDGTGDGGGDGKFAGTRVEPFQINALLTYDSPDSDPVNVNGSITLKIHYHAGVDPDTFEAKLNGKSVKELFTPKPGKSESVRIDELPEGRSKLRLSTMGIISGNVKGNSEQHRKDTKECNPSIENRARQPDEHKSKDTDVFHIVNSNK